MADIPGHEHYAGDWGNNEELQARAEEANSLIASWRSPEKDAAATASTTTTWAGWSYAESDLEWVLKSAAARCQWTYEGSGRVMSDLADVERGVKDPVLPLTKIYCPDLMETFYKENNVTPNWESPALRP